MQLKQYKTEFYKFMFNNINVYREIAQKLILLYIYNFFYSNNKQKGKNNKLVFMGGTNLRLCYNLPRRSEDLDFAYIGNKNEFPFSTMINFVVRKLKDNHFLDVEAKEINKNTNVWKSFYIFSFTTITNQKLKIKLEVDVNPPTGGVTTFNIIQNNMNYAPFIIPFNYKITSYNLDTTFMGKFGAILGRPYVKGRDIFDIWWYLNNLYLIQKLNLSYLNSVIDQINEHNNGSKLNKISLDNNGKMQFINLFQKTCFNIIKSKQQEILKDVLPFILDNGTKEIFLADLQTGAFLTKANQLINLPII